MMVNNCDKIYFIDVHFLVYYIVQTQHIPSEDMLDNIKAKLEISP
jgi:hypothetical protein